jgi:hypothetical protein
LALVNNVGSRSWTTGEYDGDSLTASVLVPLAVIVYWMMAWVFVTPIIFTLVIAA